MTRVLALETSTQIGSVAIIQDGQVLTQKISSESRSHSENIHSFVEQCLNETSLKLSDIDVFAVGQGPGSFTGIRVAANAGKTYAYAYSKPLVTLDSLYLLAEPCRPQELPVVSIINAHKNMVYFGLFDVSGAQPVYRKGPQAVQVRELVHHIPDNCLVVGDGWTSYEPYFSDELKNKVHRNSNFSDSPQAATLGLAAEKCFHQGQTLDWKSFIPLYIRASEAEETKKGILISPLK